MVETITTSRGFHIYDEPVTTSYRHEVSVYESSSAEGPHCWLRIEKKECFGPGDLPVCDEAAHLSLDQAIAIRDRLTAFIDEVPERWGITD